LVSVLLYRSAAFIVKLALQIVFHLHSKRVLVPTPVALNSLKPS